MRTGIKGIIAAFRHRTVALFAFNRKFNPKDILFRYFNFPAFRVAGILHYKTVIFTK